MDVSPPGYQEFWQAHTRRLQRTAYVLTGEGQAAQDLVQDTAVRLLVKWTHVRRADEPLAYARRTMLHLHLKNSRRRWTHERPWAAPPERASGDGTDLIDDRDLLLRALRTLPPRQRAAVVLRHLEELGEVESAAALGCSIGPSKA